MSAIYSSGFKPRGVRKDWDRTSLGNKDAARVLDKYLNRQTKDLPTGALAYWRPSGELAVMACDMPDRRRIILRIAGRNWSVEILPEAGVVQ